MLGRMTTSSDHQVIRLIAIFKTCKAIALLLLAASAFEAARAGMLARVIAWLGGLPLAEGHVGIHRLISAMTDITPRGAELIGGVALVYALLFAVEGVGLWFEKTWAEYLTVLATASLVPFELWALLERATVLRGMAILINVLIVAYLLKLVRRPRIGVHSARSVT